MKRLLTIFGLAAGLALGGLTTSEAADKLDRMVLPIAEPKRPPIMELDARKATPPPRFEVKAPAEAPNVLDCTDRRHGVRHVQRIRWAYSHADGRATRRQRLALQPFSYNGALFADSCCVAERP